MVAGKRPYKPPGRKPKGSNPYGPTMKRFDARKMFDGPNQMSDDEQVYGVWMTGDRYFIGTMKMIQEETDRLLKEKNAQVG